MALACHGRVAVVAVSNAFYAVPACLDVNVLRTHFIGGGSGGGSSSTGGGRGGQPHLHQHRHPSAAVAAARSSLPNVTATKILTFAQSSQVHPVIAMEVPRSSTALLAPSNGTTTASLDISKYLRQTASSLLLLASGRECTTMELVSVPDARAVAGSALMNKGGGIVGGGAAGAAMSGGGGGGGIIPTSVKFSAPKHGMATLPSPILAAASLSPVADTARIGHSGGGGNLSSGPLIALLTADGLVHIRSPSCIAVPLASIEVGTRPNDFFTLSSLPPPPGMNYNNNQHSRSIVATSYGGEARLLSVHPETSQDFADRLIKLSIDAFGSNGFPRLELAEALGATFSATSYVGPESTAHRRGLLKHYLESVLGLAENLGGDGGSSTTSSNIRLGGVRSSAGTGGGAGGSVTGNVSFVMSEDGQENGLEVESHMDNADEDSASANNNMPSSSLGANSLLTCTALLCLVCYQLIPPNGTAACRASKTCASAMGTVRPKESNLGISKAAVAVCELVADRLLKEVSTSFSLLTSASSIAPIASSGHHRPSPGSASMEFVESAVWLLRSCGCHEKAIDVLQERMNSPAFRNASVSGSAGGGPSSLIGGGAGSWSQIKFDSYLATHLGELWSSKDDRCCQLVLRSPATKELISRNPTLGLSVFTTAHPQNEAEWRKMKQPNDDDPLAHRSYPPKVVALLKSITPPSGGGSGGIQDELGMAESFSSFSSPGTGKEATGPLPMDSGRALAVSYLESAIGIATGRPHSQASAEDRRASLFRSEASPPDDNDERNVADMHDELSYLLLEGVISERGDQDGGEDSALGAIYRFKLRRLLSWPNSQVRSERLLGSLPSSFLREHALLLGRLGRHEDALQILYSQENSLELALEYCDVRHERQQAQLEEAKARGKDALKSLSNECAYIPLVRVALSSDPDTDRGIAAAIQVLALRRDSIDKAAALRLLPKNIPMSSVVRPFLIPAVVENESEVRHMTVASSLLRSKYIQLKQKLTEAQLKSQATLQSAMALKKMNLGDLLHSSKPSKARPVHAASPYYPGVMLVKHFFPRHLVIQAQATNNAVSMSQGSARTLTDVAFVIAESSDEALVPTMELPLKTVPPGATGSVWCILASSPQRLDGAAFLTCELRFTVSEVDAATGAPLNFGEGVASTIGGAGFGGRTYVEELQDIEVRHTEFGRDY